MLKHPNQILGTKRELQLENPRSLPNFYLPQPLDIKTNNCAFEFSILNSIKTWEREPSLIGEKYDKNAYMQFCSNLQKWSLFTIPE